MGLVGLMGDKEKPLGEGLVWLGEDFGDLDSAHSACVAVALEE